MLKKSFPSIAQCPVYGVHPVIDTANHYMIDTPQGNFCFKIPLSYGTIRGSAREVQTNIAEMVDSPVELIEFFRPYKNEVNLYVTNISRRLEKEVVQVGIYLCIIICSVCHIIKYGKKWCTTEQ